MLQMAEETGGHAFINTNDLAHAVVRLLKPDPTSTPSPTPLPIPTGTATSAKFKSSFSSRAINLAYRRGYYADDPHKPISRRQRPAAATRSLRLRRHLRRPHRHPDMRAAMMRGGPDPTQILIKVRVLPALHRHRNHPRLRNALIRQGQRPLSPLRSRLRHRPPRHPISPQPDGKIHGAFNSSSSSSIQTAASSTSQGQDSTPTSYRTPSSRKPSPTASPGIRRSVSP